MNLNLHSATLKLRSATLNLHSAIINLLCLLVRLRTSDFSYTRERVANQDMQRSLFAGDRVFYRPQTD